MPKPSVEPICPSDCLIELGSHRFRVRYRGEPREAILVRFGGVAYGYLNRCVHMERELDCEHPRVFDESGTHLRCTMHGVSYQPETGAVLGALCAGRSLASLRIEEREGRIFLADRHARIDGD